MGGGGFEAFQAVRTAGWGQASSRDGQGVGRSLCMKGARGRQRLDRGNVLLLPLLPQSLQGIAHSSPVHSARELLRPESMSDSSVGT